MPREPLNEIYVSSVDLTEPATVGYVDEVLDKYPTAIDLNNNLESINTQLESLVGSNLLGNWDSALNNNPEIINGGYASLPTPQVGDFYIVSVA